MPIAIEVNTIAATTSRVPRPVMIAFVALAAVFVALMVVRVGVLGGSSDATSATPVAPSIPSTTPAKTSTKPAATTPKVVLLPGLPAGVAHALRYSKVAVVSLYIGQAAETVPWSPRCARVPGQSEQASSPSTSAATSRPERELVRGQRVGADHARRSAPRQDRGPVLRPGRERRGCAGGAQRRRASLSSALLKGTGRDRQLPVPPQPCSRTPSGATGGSSRRSRATRRRCGRDRRLRGVPDHPAARRAGAEAPVHVRPAEQARRFMDEAMVAFEYLNCTIT